MSTKNYWTRLRQRKISRRTMLQASSRAGVGAAGLALVGCGGDDDDDSTAADDGAAAAAAGDASAAAAAAEDAAAAAREAADAASAGGDEEQAGPQYGGTVVIQGGDGGIFDPAIAIHGATDSTIFQVYDFLNYLDDGFEVTAAMSELPEVVDDVTFVYNIKPNVHWQDKAPLNGRQFTAEDAAFGIERFGFDNPEFVYKDRYASVDEFEVLDDLTMRIKAREPFAPLLGAVAEQGAFMVSRDVVDAFGDERISTDLEAAIGTGSMMITSREPDVETVLERNPNYYREGLPYFDGYRMPWISDAAQRIAQYVAGELDFVQRQWWGTQPEIETLQAEIGEENLVVVPMKASHGVATHFNTKVEPYTDARVRLALHLATDREQLLATSLGSGQIGGPIAEAIAPYGKSPDELRELPGYRSGDLREQDLAEGRQLLDASGYDPDSVAAYAGRGRLLRRPRAGSPAELC